MTSPVKEPPQAGRPAQLDLTLDTLIPTAPRSISLSKLSSPREEGKKAVSPQGKLITLEEASPLKLTEHGHHVDEMAKEFGTYHRFTEKELDELEVTINVEGKVIIGTHGQLLDTGFEEMMYVMHKNGKIYAAYPKEGVYYHSSMVPDGFDWPIVAGMLCARNGTISKIDEESGHFAGAQRIGLVVDKLNKHGAKIDLTGVTRFSQHRSSSNSDKVERADVASPVERLNLLQSILVHKVPSPILSSVSSPSLSPRSSSASPKSLSPSSRSSSPSLISSSPFSSPSSRSFSFPNIPVDSNEERMPMEGREEQRTRRSPSPLNLSRHRFDSLTNSEPASHLTQHWMRRLSIEEHDFFPLQPPSAKTPTHKYKPSSHTRHIAHSISHDIFHHDGSQS